MSSAQCFMTLLHYIVSMKSLMSLHLSMAGPYPIEAAFFHSLTALPESSTTPLPLQQHQP